MENKNFLAWSIVAAAVIVGGALIYSAGLKNTPSNQQANAGGTVKAGAPQIDDDVILGNFDALVTVFEFGDYQCPYCGKFFEETEPLIRKDYVEAGKVKMVYKDLAFLGPESTAAAQAAQCAGDQGKYWQYHDALYTIEYQEFLSFGNNESTGNLNRGLFEKIASDLGMDTGQFLSCFDSKKYEAEVKKDTEEAKSLMDRVSTPTIFVNDKIFQGALPYSTFKDAIDAALTQNK